MKELNPDYKVENDPVPEMTRAHFEIAMANSRRSIS